MNTNRQLRFAAVLAVMLCVAGSLLYEIARADTTSDLPNGGPDLSFTNSPNLRLSGQVDSLGRFQLLGTNANWQGSYFFVQASTNLVNWVQIGSIYPWSTNVVGSGFVFTDTSPVGSSRRYYRVVDNLLNVSTAP